MRAGGPRKDYLDQLAFGLHYGIVCQNVDPDQLDRIKIRLPWLDGGDKDQMHWAQLMTVQAGRGFGWYTLPEINDVVVVCFIGGDFSQPVIMGGVWSTPDFSPEPNEDGKNNFRGYRSRAGHRMILDDSAKPKVVFSDKTGKLMVGVGNFAKDGVGPNVSATYKPPMSGDVGVSISAMQGSMEITCKDGKLTVTAGKDIKINSKETFDVKAGGEVKLDGSSSAKLTSGDPSSYDGKEIKLL